MDAAFPEPQQPGPPPKRRAGRIVLAFVSTAHKAHRDKLEGIRRHAAASEWILETTGGDPFGFSLRTMRDLDRCDGIIVDDLLGFPAVPLARIRAPFVLLDPEPEFDGRFPSVSYDSGACGRLAAETLLRGRYASFGFVPALPEADWEHPACRPYRNALLRIGETPAPVPTVPWSDERGRAFARALRQAGRPCAVFHPSRAGVEAAADRRALAAWLRTLATPCAVFAAMDLRAAAVRDACRLARLSIPSDVAVLSVDNDPAICEGHAATLSSIQPDFAHGGAMAAALLDSLMDAPGRDGHSLRLRYGPGCLVERSSTRRLGAGVDVRVAKALEFIRLHGTNGIGPADVARHMGVGPRMAERLFARHGCSIVSQIASARLDAARILLETTRLPVFRIAADCGFSSAAYAADCFRARFGVSMRQWRLRAARSSTRTSTLPPPPA